MHAKDVMRTLEDEGNLRALRAQVRADDVIREVLTVPENRRVDAVLQNLQDRRLRMAIVIHEWGSFEGIITMEDIVGEIRDEFNEEGPRRQRAPTRPYSMHGGIPIRESNSALGSGFRSGDFSTVGSLVFGCLGRVSKAGDEVRLEGHLLRVEDVDGSRVVARKEPA